MSEWKPAPDSKGKWERHIKWSNGTSISTYKIKQDKKGFKWYNKELKTWMYADWFEGISEIRWRKIC